MIKGLEKYSNLKSSLVETGVISLDLILGGGHEEGDVIEIASPSGVGKTTLMLNVCKNFCIMGRKVVYLDVERGVKEKTLRSTGLYDLIGKGFEILYPTTYDDMETIFDKVLNIDNKETYAQEIVIDSINSVLPSKLLKKSISEIEPGLEARLMSSFFKKYKSVLRETGSTMWCINQMRTHMDFIRGSTTDSAGGNALRYYTDVRLRLEKGAQLKRMEVTVSGEKEVSYGNVARIMAVKNRGERPEIPIELPIIFGLGVSNIMTMKTIMLDNGLITGGHGGFYKVILNETETESVRGTNELNQFIKSNRDKILLRMRELGVLTLTRGEKDNK